MTLSAGQRLGPYEILSPLGAGGMGEVYKAREMTMSSLPGCSLLGTCPADHYDITMVF